MTSRAQRVLVVVVIDPTWRLELRQEDSLAASQTVLTTINANRGFLFPKTRNLKIYGFKKFSRIDLKPTNGHRVCGQHFEGGKKTY